jgi:hypothetical protein
MADEPQPAALGWRAHSGWAVLVAVAGPPSGRMARTGSSAPAAVGRWRVELATPESGGSPQPYHLAAEAAGLNARRASAADVSGAAGEALDLEAAERIVRRAAEAAAGLARRAVAAAAGDLGGRGFEVVGCGLVLASGRPAPSLAATLASHALIHTAEGELFRQAIVRACESQGLRVSGVRERDLAPRAAAELGLGAAELGRHAAEMGRALGPPWRQDEKQAALAAWLALAGP